MDALKKIFNIFTTLLVTAVLLLAIALVGVRVVGIRPFTVLSGSMEPTYHTGSVIYVKSVDYRELKVGDPITFMLNEDTVATHRIVEIVPDEEDPTVLRYRTKGDANETEDGGLVHYKNVVGKPVFTIPKIGFLVNYIQKPPGTYVAIAGGAFAVLLLFLPELIKALTGDEEEEKDKPKRGAEKAQRDKKSSADKVKTDMPRRAKPAEPPRRKPEEKARDDIFSVEYDSIDTHGSAITDTEPVYERRTPLPSEETPAAEDRPLTRAELRRQAEAAEKAAGRSRSPSTRTAAPRKTAHVLPQKKKGRHEL